MKQKSQDDGVDMDPSKVKKQNALNAGTLYGVGVGPGDPDLITVKAVNVLKIVDVVFAASSVKNRYSKAIAAAEAYIPEDTPVHILPFLMSKDEEELHAAWKKNAETILEVLNDGKNAAFLTLGDSMTYSTYGYILKNLKMCDPNVKIETVPGITSYQAAAATLGTPLVEGEESLMVISGVNGGDILRNQSVKPDTVVFMKAYKNVEDIVDALNENNDYSYSRGVSNISTDKEKTINDISSFKNNKPDYWTIIVAKRNSKKKCGD